MQESYTENLINNLRQDRNLRGNSKNWANWMSMLTLTSCKFCIEQQGKRNRQRVLYSSDGFIFVTYDHYQTFYEITE
jgi:hypothetical protein